MNQPAHKGRILHVVSSVTNYETDPTHPTGLWLSELVHPYLAATLVKRKSLTDWDELHAVLAKTNSVEMEILNLKDELETITGVMTKSDRRQQADPTRPDLNTSPASLSRRTLPAHRHHAR